MDILIIAPTKDLYRDPAQKEINDTIKDQTDAVNLEERINKIVPEEKRSPNQTELKRYHDMRATHIGVAKADLKARKFEEHRYNTRNRNGVSFPDTGQESNECYIRISQDCKSNR